MDHTDTIARFAAEIEAKRKVTLATTQARLARQKQVKQAGYLWARDTATYQELVNVIDRSAISVETWQVLHKIPDFNHPEDFPAFRTGATELWNEVRDHLPNHTIGGKTYRRDGPAGGYYPH